MTHRLLHIIERSLLRQKRQKYLVGFWLLSMGMGGCLWALYNEVDWKTTMALGFFLGLFLMMGLLLIRSGKRDYETGRIFWEEFLSFHSEEIVWVYYFKLENMPFGVRFNEQNTLFFSLKNGNQIQLKMKETEILQLMDLLQQKLPSASFGYNRHKEQLFNISPELLWNQQEEEE